MKISWPESKRHKFYSESACGNYRVTRDGDKLMGAWIRYEKKGFCEKPGCGHTRPCELPHCDLIGWRCAGFSWDWKEILGLLHGTLDQNDIRRGRAYPLRPCHMEAMSQIGDIPQMGDVDQPAGSVDT